MQAQKLVSDFVEDFGHYLENPRWLPFAYAPQGRAEGSFVFHPQTGAYRCAFFLKHRGSAFASIEVVPCFNPPDSGSRRIAHVMITFLQAYNEAMREVVHARIRGVEMLRRMALFSFEKGYGKLTTAMCPRSASYFLYNGFLGVDGVFLDFKLENGFPDRAALAQWRGFIKRDPLALCRFSGTPLGRKLLETHHGCGILDFRDPRQCAYAFNERFKIPLQFG